MDSQEILASLKASLDTTGIDSLIHHPIDPAQPLRLLIFAGDAGDRQGGLIEFSLQTVEMGEGAKSKPGKRTYMRMQIDSKFPFKVVDTSLVEVAQFLNFLNLQLELPGFFLNYFENTIIYRYVLLADADHVPEKVILSVIGVIMFFQDFLGGTLGRLAAGQTTFIELLQDIETVLKRP